MSLDERPDTELHHRPSHLRSPAWPGRTILSVHPTPRSGAWDWCPDPEIMQCYGVVERIRKLTERFLCMSNLLRTNNVESRTLFQFGVNYRIKRRETPQALLGHEVTPDQKHLHALAGWSHWGYFPNINMNIFHQTYIFFSEEEILFFSLSNLR